MDFDDEDLKNIKQINAITVSLIYRHRQKEEFIRSIEGQIYNPNTIYLPGHPFYGLTEAEIRKYTNIDKSIPSEQIEKPSIAKNDGGNKMALINVKGLYLSKTPRKDGRYMGRYLVNGKFDYFYAKTYDELTEIALKIIKGKKQTKSQSQSSYKQWAEKWLELYHRKKTSDKVFRNDCAIFKNHIYPHLANKILTRMTGVEVQETINKCPYPRQRQIVANLLTASLRKAYEIDIIKKDITKAVEKPTHEIDGSKPLTMAEQKMLLDRLEGHELEYYITLLLFSGLRRNEALGLEWRHLDFDNDTIKVEQQATDDGGITTRLKTKTSKRLVKMFPQIKAAFYILSKDKDPNARLFSFMPDYVTREFRAFCNKIGLKHHTIKGNRTTFATRCEEMGISSKVVQAWLGHSKLDTTVNVYQKTNNEFIEQEFKKILEKFDTKIDTNLD